MKKFLAAAVISAALLTGLTACGSSGHIESGSTTNTATSKPAAAPSKAPETNPHFGQAYVYDDGLSVSVSAPQPYTPSPNAAGATAATNLIFTITVKNGTKENFDPSLMLNSLNSGSTAASVITDLQGPQGDVTGFAPQTPLTPGQSVSFKTAYSVADANDLTMSIKLTDFKHKDLLFVK